MFGWFKKNNKPNPISFEDSIRKFREIDEAIISEIENERNIQKESLDRFREYIVKEIKNDFCKRFIHSEPNDFSKKVCVPKIWIELNNCPLTSDTILSEEFFKDLKSYLELSFVEYHMECYFSIDDTFDRCNIVGDDFYSPCLNIHYKFNIFKNVRYYNTFDQLVCFDTIRGKYQELKLGQSIYEMSELINDI